jgi:hypothetical protein
MSARVVSQPRALYWVNAQTGENRGLETTSLDVAEPMCAERDRVRHEP